MLVCEHCDKEFTKSPYTRIKNQRFCSNYCRERAYYLRNKDKISKYIKQKRIKDKEEYGKGYRRVYPKAIEISAWYAELKSQPCTDCGQCFPPCCMDFDHVIGSKTDNISRMIQQQYSLERVKEEIAKCELVCANCHRIRTRDNQVGKDCWGKKVVKFD